MVRAVRQYLYDGTVKDFDSVAIAARETRINPTSIGLVCKNKKKTA